jgi:single-stranded-DNA-specific exonuclease
METYGELLRSLLEGRGYKTNDEAERFLNPNYERDFHDPFLMRDMEKACVRIFEAVEGGEKIVVYADYDCDGIPGAVILTDFFKKIGYQNFEIYIPERNSEGYGLNIEAIKGFAESNAKLLITIDLGITALAEVAQAEVLGMDTIITDHHLPPETLPRAYAILNPKVDDYPEKMLCGSGVVFKLVQGFFKKYGEYFKVKEGSEKWMLDMAGLATLSDMVPLRGENRAIAYFGLMVLRKSPRPGLQKLLAKMNIEQRHLSEDDVGFMLTPRLNAASRMASPRLAYDLLATEDTVQGGMIADKLSKINDERKSIVVGIMKEVNKKFEKLDDEEVKEVVVIGNPNWRIGVLGLVAGKIVDQYQRPCFVWGKDENDVIKGSCRSDGSVSVVELMAGAKEHFREFGGHEGAGGFTVHADKIHFLEDALRESFKKIKGDRKEEIKLGKAHDVSTDLGAVSMKNWREISKLAPFGCENEKPTFLFQGVKIENLKKFGKNGSGEHLEVSFSDSGGSTKGVSFFSGLESFKTPLTEGKNVNLLATFDLSRFRGREELRLRIEEIH